MNRSNSGSRGNTMGTIRNHSTNSMARRTLSNTLLSSIRTPFSRRKNGHGGGGGGGDGSSKSLDRSTSGSLEGSTHCCTQHQPQNDLRKVSIDHTVLTRDETLTSATIGGHSFEEPQQQFHHPPRQQQQFSNSHQQPPRQQQQLSNSLDGSFLYGNSFGYYAELEAQHQQQQQQQQAAALYKSHSEPDFLHHQQQQREQQGGGGTGGGGHPPLLEGGSLEGTIGSGADVHFSNTNSSMVAAAQQQQVQGGGIHYAPGRRLCYDPQEHHHLQEHPHPHHQQLPPPQQQQHQQQEGSSSSSLLLQAQLSSSPCSAVSSSEDPALQARIEAIQIQSNLLGQNHPDVIFALSSLAKLHSRRGNHAEAAAILKESRLRGLMANNTPTSLNSAGGTGMGVEGGCIRNPQEEPPLNIPTEISFAHLG